MSIGGLGNGLDFLYEENTADTQAPRTLRLTEIEPNRDQPRKEFKEEAIQALADSIRQYGMLQPIVVRPMGLNYQIVAGERRWRAARMLGLTEVPVIIRELDDNETAAIALIENLQRENLNPMEEAMGYSQLIDEYQMSKEDLSKAMGRSRSAISNSLRLLNLSEEIQQLVKDGKVSAGHAKALLSIEDEELREEVAAKCAKGKLTVRAVEKIASKEKQNLPQSDFTFNSFYMEMEAAMANETGRRVVIKEAKNGNGGKITFDFFNRDDLVWMCNVIASQDMERKISHD